MIKKEDVQRFLQGKDWKDSTKRVYMHILARYLAEWLEKENIDLAEMDEAGFRSWIQYRGWTQNTKYLASVAVRQFVQKQYGESHPLSNLRLRRRDAGPQNTLEDDEAAILLASFNSHTPKGIRDRAMTAFMLDTGVRAFEVCGLMLKHIKTSKQTVTLLTKGDEWEDKVYSPETAEYLNAWLAIRSKFASDGVTTVFVSIGGQTRGRPLTTDGVKAIYRYIRDKTGIDALSPHALRRTMATLAIQNGAPSRIVQLQGGWSRLEMVERYTKRLKPKDFSPYFPVSNLRPHKGRTKNAHDQEQPQSVPHKFVGRFYGTKMRKFRRTKSNSSE